MTPILELAGVTAFYGQVQALHGVSLTVAEGELVALLGRNGMGKTTTIRTITRLLAHRTGSIRFNGTDLARLPPHRAARLGLGLVPEGRRIFAGLTVTENLTAAARPGRWDMARAYALFPRLDERRDQRAETLSGGEQQMLAIARALLTNPRLLLLDEATEGLAPVVRQEIWTAVTELKREGLAILLVDKPVPPLLAVADRVVIIERGHDVWHGTPNGLTAEVTTRWLGV